MRILRQYEELGTRYGDPGEVEGSSGDGEPSGDLPQDEPRHDDECRHCINGGAHPPEVVQASA
jgi:hypothetical protein